MKQKIIIISGWVVFILLSGALALFLTNRYSEFSQLPASTKEELKLLAYNDNVLNDKDIFRIHKKLAKLLDPSNGKTEEEKIKNINRILEKLIKQGSSYAQSLLSSIYLAESGGLITESGIKRETVEGWLFRAGKSGNPKALKDLCQAYRYGIGIIRKDEIAAKVWCKVKYEIYLELAKKGNFIAQYEMGLLHAGGDGKYDKFYGIQTSAEQAAKWYKKSAEQGHYLSQKNIAYYYENGIGVIQNYNLAEKWYKKSLISYREEGIEFDSGIASDLVFLFYYTKKDKFKAYVWALIAKDSVSNIRDEIEPELTLEEIEKAQDLAVKCVESGYKECD